MNVLQRIGFLFTTVVITSCATFQPKFPEVQLPPERILQNGYSLVPLNEKGWLIVGRNAYQLGLGKRGERPDETFGILAITFKLPTFKTHADFVGTIKEGQALETNTGRFRIVKQEVEDYLIKGPDCVKSYLLAEDRAAVKISSKSGNMLLEALTLTCAHPKDRNVGISIIYSHRYYSGERDSAFTEKAMSVLNQVELTDF